MCTLMSIVKCKNILLEGLNPFHGVNLYLPENYKSSLHVGGGGVGVGGGREAQANMEENDGERLP